MGCALDPRRQQHRHPANRRKSAGCARRMAPRAMVGRGGTAARRRWHRPEEAFGSPALIGHHANWAARRCGAAISELRHGHLVQRDIPVTPHMLRTIIASVVYQAGMQSVAEGWLQRRIILARPANAPCNVGYARTWGRSGPECPRAQTRLSLHISPDWASPLVRPRSCGSSTPDSATPNSPIGYSSPPELWNPTSVACCKRPDEPAEAVAVSQQH